MLPREFVVEDAAGRDVGGRRASATPKLARNARRSSLLREGESPVELSYFDVNGKAAFPLLVSCRDPDLRLESWVKEHQGGLEKHLLDRGAVVFRGFQVETASVFSEIASQLCGGLHEDYADLPRSRVGERIYHPTEYPADEMLLLHNEGAHLPAWPLKMCFHCQTPAESGGETTLMDCETMWELMDEDLRSALDEKGLVYVRNFHPHMDQPWQAVFQETDPGRVEAMCRTSGIEFAWTGEGSLRTSYRVPARVPHPVTGARLFLSQLLLFHPACLPSVVRRSLECLLPREFFPRDATFGDGSAIPDEMVIRFREACDRHAFRIPWRKGDIAWVDNMRVAHGRMPFAGDRQIFVAMGGMCGHGP